MEESVAEIMNQLGADEHGKISFQDFTRCRMQLVREIRKEEVGLSEKSDNSCKKKTLRDRIASWPTSSDNSLGALSAARESWEYDSGARDLQSPDLQGQWALQKLLEYGGRSLHPQAAILHTLLARSRHLGSSVGGSYLELANTNTSFGLCVFQYRHFHFELQGTYWVLSFFWSSTLYSIARNVKGSKHVCSVTSLSSLRAECTPKRRSDEVCPVRGFNYWNNAISMSMARVLLRLTENKTHWHKSTNRICESEATVKGQNEPDTLGRELRRPCWTFKLTCLNEHYGQWSQMQRVQGPSGALSWSPSHMHSMALWRHTRRVELSTTVLSAETAGTNGAQTYSPILIDTSATCCSHLLRGTYSLAKQSLQKLFKRDPVEAATIWKDLRASTVVYLLNYRCLDVHGGRKRYAFCYD
ncbi:hypothetical protein PANDA_020568 [Ailuropoda melanoleuca]|uniref:EF-hand domain-containing protein n=1 Tax=Ailuropoda melanoleuca TaxID=9646 RepID=D2I4N1_AILME|nr:hypothetical protein PANDA_020568 [Ailuropoda melanoleuca]